jgi:hypothetical protein
MATIAEANVVLALEGLTAFNNHLATAHANLRSFVGQTASMLTGIGVGMSSRGMAEFFSESIQGAAALQESMAKIQVVFGTSSGIVSSMVEDLAAKFGLIKGPSLDAAANIGLILESSGMTKAAAAEMSASLLRLGADASRMFDKDFGVGIAKITSGLVGQSRPLREFGVMLDVNAVKQEAYRSGLAQTGAELTMQQKVQARAAIIMRELGFATGTLEREQGNLSAQLSKVQGDWANFQAAIGTAMIPAINELISLGYTLGEAFEIAFGTAPMDTFKGAMEGVASGLMGFRLYIKAVVLDFQDMALLGRQLKAGDFAGAGATAKKLITNQNAVDVNEAELFKHLGKGIVGAAGEVFGPGVDAEKFIPPEVATKAAKKSAYDKKLDKIIYGVEPGGVGFGAFGMFGNVGQMVNQAAMSEEFDYRIRKEKEQGGWSGGHVTDSMSFLKSAQEQILKGPDETQKRQLKELEEIRKLIAASGPNKLAAVAKGPVH